MVLCHHWPCPPSPPFLGALNYNFVWKSKVMVTRSYDYNNKSVLIHLFPSLVSEESKRYLRIDSSSEITPGPKIPRRGRERISRTRRQGILLRREVQTGADCWPETCWYWYRTDKAGGIDHLPVCGFSLKCPWLFSIHPLPPSPRSWTKTLRHARFPKQEKFP